MPAMPRTDERLEKLAYKIIGKPVNMRSKDKKEKSKVDRELTFEETTRVR